MRNELDGIIKEKVDETVAVKLQTLKDEYQINFPLLPNPDENNPIIPNTPISNVRLTTAVNEAMIERDNIEKRKLKLMLHNLKEVENATEDINQVKQLLSEKLEITEDIAITDITRIGNRRTDNKPRLLRIELSTLSQKRIILASATKLRQLNEEDPFARVYIRPDLTPKQQEASKNLYRELVAQREEDPDSRYKIKKGQIIKLED